MKIFKSGMLVVIMIAIGIVNWLISLHERTIIPACIIILILHAGLALLLCRFLNRAQLKTAIFLSYLVQLVLVATVLFSKLSDTAISWMIYYGGLWYLATALNELLLTLLGKTASLDGEMLHIIALLLTQILIPLSYYFVNSLIKKDL
ncbi:MAG: hypothetical protein LBR25_07545 [Erysipelotrichaceae bacterium]|jgi:hypothetical protein|nr:hypothetical protein [Erysipelotrichaceae bacterium]